MKYQLTSMLSENISKTSEGFLICKNVPLARPGELTYLKSELPGFEDSNGRIIASRDAEDILSADTMASFEGKTLSYLHPKEKEINATNWKTHAVGTIFNVRAGDGQNLNLLVGDILVQDAQAVEAVMHRGLREVSLGYEAQYFQEGKGRVRQKNIKGNHVALVPRGRCGALCAIQDHAAFLSTETENMSIKEKLKGIFSKVIDEASFEEDEPKPKTTTDTQALEAKVTKLSTDLAGVVTNLTKVVDALADLKKETPAAETEEAKAARLKKEKEEIEAKPNTVADAATFSLAEVLAPGLQNSATVKVDALKAAYKTTDGKAVIDVFTSGKEVDYNSPTAVDVAFLGAANLLKAKRTNDKSAVRPRFATLDNKSAMTPEAINKANEEFWFKKTA